MFINSIIKNNIKSNNVSYYVKNYVSSTNDYLNYGYIRDQAPIIILSNKKNYTLSEIELLRDDNLDPDMISEIVQNSLGLIHSDQIVIEITK